MSRKNKCVLKVYSQRCQKMGSVYCFQYMRSIKKERIQKKGRKKAPAEAINLQPPIINKKNTLTRNQNPPPKNNTYKLEYPKEVNKRNKSLYRPSSDKNTISSGTLIWQHPIWLNWAPTTFHTTRRPFHKSLWWTHNVKANDPPILNTFKFQHMKHLFTTKSPPLPKVVLSRYYPTSKLLHEIPKERKKAIDIWIVQAVAKKQEGPLWLAHTITVLGSW